MQFFEQSVQEILGLKPLVVGHLKRLSIACMRDLLFHVPVYYMEKKIDPNLEQTEQDQIIIASISIQSVPGFSDKIKKFIATNIHGQQIQLIFFAQVPKFMWSYLKVGMNTTIEGRVKFEKGVAQIAHPDIVFNRSLIKKIEPIYNLTQGITNKQLHRYISMGLNLLPQILSWHNLEQQLNLPSLRDSLINLHDPSDVESLDIYIKRMALEEILVNQFLLNKIRSKGKSQSSAQIISQAKYYDQVITNIGFSPTDDQQQVLSQISYDQNSGQRMCRILQGDVGCGKTLVGLLSMLASIENGFGCAIMAPTEILSIQHYNFFQKALKGTRIEVGLLVGSIKGKARQQIMESVASGKIQILVGTHALFQEAVVFANLKYVIIDEQHRFGVRQRLDLVNKAQNADLLLMSATPIPRSLNMVLYGDMDVSYIKSKPKNNLPIITRIMSDAKISELSNSLNNVFDKRQKVYWICPLIEESEHKNYANVLARYEALKLIYQEKVGILHGGMMQTQKDQIMEEFKNGQIDLLVATTVIEVGIDVPNATLIVVEDANAFGLSQLHQLRGRVGRSSLQSYCILVYKAKSLSEVGKKRLNIIKNSTDGFEIAEQDLLLRGAGDFIGSRQSGQNSFIFTNLVNDLAMLELAKNFITQNPDMIPSDYIIRIFDKDGIAQESMLA